MQLHHIDGKNFMEDFFEKPQKIVFLKLYSNEYIYNKAYMMKKLGKGIRFNNWCQLLLIVQYFKRNVYLYAIFEILSKIDENSVDCKEWNYHVMKKLDIDKVRYDIKD